jgi:hypothetical protein
MAELKATSPQEYQVSVLSVAGIFNLTAFSNIITVCDRKIIIYVLLFAINTS